MLGDQIGEETGKVIVRRVLPTEGSPKVEVSFQTTGKLLGVDHRSIGTYIASSRPDGSAYGEAQGIVIGKNGERATWKAQGVGRMLADGSVSYRGATYYETQSANWKRLNTIAVLFEYEADAEGNTRTKSWEWK